MFLGCSFIFSGCSSASKKSVHSIHQLWLYNLHYRRPPQIGADPDAAYGELEYESHPKPNAQFDCLPLKNLFSNLNLDSIRSCLQSSNQMMMSQSLYYELHREISPYLALQDPDQAPDCFRALLVNIPIPREIFFQSNEGGQLNCYSSRIWLSKDVFLGIKDSLSSFNVEVKFPIPNLPTTHDETLMLLTSWVMMAYWDDSGHGFVSRIVPDDMCQKCMGRENMFLEGDRLPPLWP